MSLASRSTPRRSVPTRPGNPRFTPRIRFGGSGSVVRGCSPRSLRLRVPLAPPRRPRLEPSALPRGRLRTGVPATPVKGVCASSRLEVPSASPVPPVRAGGSPLRSVHSSPDLAVGLAAPSARRATFGASASLRSPPGSLPNSNVLDTDDTCSASAVFNRPTSASARSEPRPPSTRSHEESWPYWRPASRRLPRGLSHHPETVLLPSPPSPIRWTASIRGDGSSSVFSPRRTLQRPASSSPPARRDPASFVAPGRARRLGSPPSLSLGPRPPFRSEERSNDRMPSPDTEILDRSP